ncbi:MAG TPA: hypothetical protein VFZ53_31090, partial [Polyangiaceae bacterium]
DELARACVDSADWPELARMAPRSLSALFSKLDRDENLGWLAGRPEVQLGLARVLGTNRETIRLALIPKKGAEPSRFVTWDVLPYARVLDLVEESLFPGLPSEVLRPGGWQKLVWLAPNGAGRSLVGAMLEARGLAQHLSAPCIADTAIPNARPLFLELGSGEGLDLEAVPPGICVALPETSSVPASSDARVVRSRPVAEVLDELVAWCRARLAANSGLEPARFVRWLRSGPLESGTVLSAGDVLGLAGLADVLGIEALETQPLARVARDVVRRRGAERLDPDGPSTPWARRSGFDALVAIQRRFIADGEPPFLERSSEAWSLVLPAELRHGPDLEWLRAALPGAEPGLLRSDVERAVTKLPPGAFRLLRTFETLGVLERSPNDGLALRPHWLVRVAMGEALAELVDGPPAGFGEALLSPKTALLAARRLFERAHAAKLLLDDVIEPDALDSPVHAAAVEGAFRSVGLAALFGTEPPADGTEALWNEGLRLAFEPPGALPSPRIDHAALDAPEPSAWLLGRGAFFLGALALSEGLEASEGRAHALLRPWQATRAPDGLSAVLDVVSRDLEHPGAPAELVAHATALVSRLRAVLGPLGPNDTPHHLERASVVADETALGVLTWASLAPLATDRIARIGTRELVVTRKLEHAFAEGVAAAYRDAGFPPEGAGVLLSPELAALLVSNAPDDVLTALLARLAETGAAELVGSRLPALLEHAPHDLPVALFRELPEPALGAAVAFAARAHRDDVLLELWRRFPDALARTLHARLVRTDDASRSAVGALLRTAPREARPALVRSLDDIEALLKSPAETLASARSLLHLHIAERGPGWRDVYSLFGELETRCRALTRLSAPVPSTRRPPAN